MGDGPSEIAAHRNELKGEGKWASIMCGPSCKETEQLSEPKPSDHLCDQDRAEPGCRGAEGSFKLRQHPD